MRAWVLSPGLMQEGCARPGDAAENQEVLGRMVTAGCFAPHGCIFNRYIQSWKGYAPENLLFFLLTPHLILKKKQPVDRVEYGNI